MSPLFARMTLFILLLALPLYAIACDAGDGGGDGNVTSDCRQAAWACASGFTCTEDGQGDYTCVADGADPGGGDEDDVQGPGDPPSSDAGGGGPEPDTAEIPGLSGGPSTECLYTYGTADFASDFGQACDADSGCAHGACIMPGDEGNITNDLFGFCSRGCDCDDAGAAALSGSDPDYECAYPGGCWVSQSQGAWRHAVLKCSTLDDCLTVDPRYTDCEYTGKLTVIEGETCGSLTKVCQAHAP